MEDSCLKQIGILSANEQKTIVFDAPSESLLFSLLWKEENKKKKEKNVSYVKANQQLELLST